MKRTAVAAEAFNIVQHRRTGKWRFFLTFPFSEGEGTITIKSEYGYENEYEAWAAMKKQAKAHNVKVWG